MDGDGKLDRIRHEQGGFTVNGRHTSYCTGPEEFCGSPDKCFTITDLDVRDRQKELIFMNPASGMTAEVRVYARRRHSAWAGPLGPFWAITVRAQTR